jgi:2-polyprenyl-6-methoxyphenol hydroxylase-like FAD-dependent oxidoreductase
MTRVEEAQSIRTPVVVVGGGPVGMVTAFELSQLGIPCLLAEQSTETTKWPKMDLINCRTMEIFRMLGIAGELRAEKDAVAAEYDFDTLFFTSCGPGGQLIARWVRLTTILHKSVITTSESLIKYSHYRLFTSFENYILKSTMALTLQSLINGVHK